MRQRGALLVIAAAVALCIALPALAAVHRRTDGPRRSTPPIATIRRTEHGIPHIEASSYRGLGYGFGYAFAQDNLCTMAEDYVTVDAQRSRYFGANASYLQRANGVTTNNLDSDFYYQQIIDSHLIENLLAKPPPLGLEPEAKQTVSGYVAGYNRYLADVGGSRGVPDPTCRGKPWVHPITEATAYRRFYQLIGF